MNTFSSTRKAISNERSASTAKRLSSDFSAPSSPSMSSPSAVTTFCAAASSVSSNSSSVTISTDAATTDGSSMSGSTSTSTVDVSTDVTTASRASSVLGALLRLPCVLVALTTSTSWKDIVFCSNSGSKTSVSSLGLAKKANLPERSCCVWTSSASIIMRSASSAARLRSASSAARLRSSTRLASAASRARRISSFRFSDSSINSCFAMRASSFALSAASLVALDESVFSRASSTATLTSASQSALNSSRSNKIPSSSSSCTPYRKYLRLVAAAGPAQSAASEPMVSICPLMGSNLWIASSIVFVGLPRASFCPSRSSREHIIAVTTSRRAFSSITPSRDLRTSLVNQVSSGLEIQ
mmetsp:Transcript_7708/g.11246  ORF Transcript_7708/g.11246 Transcript_7708/m.11246 type:complete len:356 (+) Transcript_7708:1372-2439(+)